MSRDAWRVALVMMVCCQAFLAGCSSTTSVTNPEPSEASQQALEIAWNVPTSAPAGTTLQLTASIINSGPVGWEWMVEGRLFYGPNVTIGIPMQGSLDVTATAKQDQQILASRFATIRVVVPAQETPATGDGGEQELDILPEFAASVRLADEPATTDIFVVSVNATLPLEQVTVWLDGFSVPAKMVPGGFELQAPPTPGPAEMTYVLVAGDEYVEGNLNFEVWGHPIAFGLADQATIRPGMTSSVCTTNFLFHYKYYRYFIGSAAHCLDESDVTSSTTNGCLATLRPIGDTELLEGAVEVQIAYSSWTLMQEAGETNGDVCYGNDFALLEISSTDWASMHPSIHGLDIVKGILKTAPEPALVWGGSGTGRELVAYGRSSMRDCARQCYTDYHEAYLDQKEGHLLFTRASNFTHQVYLLPQGIPGDSGGPLLTRDGFAMGVASTIQYAPYAGSNGYTNLDMALKYMEAHLGWRPDIVSWDP